MGQSLTALAVQESGIPGIKYLRAEYADGSRRYVRFREEASVHTDRDALEVNPAFCRPHNMHPSHCGSFLSPDISKRFVMDHGAPCRSLTFRPGSVIDDPRPVPGDVTEYVTEGTLCRFVNVDYLYSDSDLARCCMSDNRSECPTVLNNGYETDHCDDIMSARCPGDPGSPNCLLWLSKKREVALATYSGICSENLDQSYCSDFVDYTRPDFFSYSDAAIIRYCLEHRHDPRCWCVVTPGTNMPELELALGPKVCWLHECTDRTRDRKYLLFSQDVQRKYCKYVGCRINVETLKLTNSTADLIAACRGAGAGDAVEEGESDGAMDTQEEFVGWLPIPMAMICMFVLFYFLCIYNRDLVNSNRINVRRE
ncbi:myristylated protein [Western grey kangaroopox virus]|uniref:Myristylated protein n=1 Tax=Western grey kangaroopox virus TaxID=1566307 RepID=A0A2C9DSS1_9POXV|nr:myristylated protein [Western grey kangaroopox virus]ATI21054.1 myristylated protein [Western grey kangaroopox virus]